MRVFLVDDDLDLVEMMTMVIADRGHRVETAFNGRQAVDRCLSTDFDVVFMDIRMPQMNGVESFFAIRNLKPNVRVYLMTGYSYEELTAQAVAGGVAGVLRKPLDMQHVLQLIEESPALAERQ
jgi:two-component system, NtrC family, response regulator HydG